MSKADVIEIESVKYVVNKYEGDIKIEINEKKFCVSGVLLQPPEI